MLPKCYSTVSCRDVTIPDVARRPVCTAAWKRVNYNDYPHGVLRTLNHQTKQKTHFFHHDM